MDQDLICDLNWVMMQLGFKSSKICKTQFGLGRLGHYVSTCRAQISRLTQYRLAKSIFVKGLRADREETLNLFLVVEPKVRVSSPPPGIPRP